MAGKKFTPFTKKSDNDGDEAPPKNMHKNMHKGKPPFAGKKKFVKKAPAKKAAAKKAVPAKGKGKLPPWLNKEKSSY